MHLKGVNGIKFIGLSLVMVLLAFAGPPANAQKEGIRGRIIEIRPAAADANTAFIGTVLVEANRPVKVGYDKVYLIVTGETRIFKGEGDRRLQASFEDLKVGGMVEAQFVEGPVVLIYPLQVAASEIVILTGEAKE